ncbi:MAG: hypothetical protein WC831_04710 [Parcubacteria group bacterium]
MAYQISHVVYAKKYLEKNPRSDADAFMLGTLFPDVRKVAPEIRRRDTHFILQELNPDFSKLSPFRAGWKFHLWCDMRREEILNGYEFYSLGEITDYEDGLTAKLLEDELVYERYNNWEKLCYLLNNPPAIESSLPVSQETIERWYAVIAKYFEKKPDDRTIKIFLMKQPSFADDAEGIIDSLRKLRNNLKVAEILTKISEEIII